MILALFIAANLLSLVSVMFLTLTFRRYLLWTVVCRRGRRCARLEPGPTPEGVPAGAVLHLDWTCGGCTTSYTGSWLVANDGELVTTGTERA